MKIVAICCTLVRQDFGELLGMWALQSLQLPLFLALDVDSARWLPEVPVQVGSDDNAEHGEAEWIAQRAPERVRREAYPTSIGPLRAWAVERARVLWSLQDDDAILILDDDDYYSPHHARCTLAALAAAPNCIVGARNFGIQWSAAQWDGTEAPELVRGGPHGPGPHATWAMTVRTYKAAGGYQPGKEEDLELLSRWGWQRTRSHTDVTHVRRQREVSFSSKQGDRAAVETGGPVDCIPQVTTRMERLALWCDAQRA